jgi:3-oxoadipate enol-lactonase
VAFPERANLTAAAHPADRYVTVGDARLRYRDQGDGAAVILVHGWTLDLEMWDPQVAALSTAFRLVRFDRRGYGLSGGRPSGEQDATDIAALCAHLGLDRVALIGMSQGARSVLRFAGNVPKHVWAVVLDGPPAMGRTEVDGEVPIAHFREVVRTQGLEAFRREWSNHALMQLHTRDPQMRSLVNRMIERYPGHDIGPGEAAGAGASPVSLNSVLTPTLVLSGEHDLPSRVRAAQLLCAQLPSAERRSIAGAGHLANLDQPTVYSELCRAFFARHASGTVS